LETCHGEGQDVRVSQKREPRIYTGEDDGEISGETRNGEKATRFFRKEWYSVSLRKSLWIMLGGVLFLFLLLGGSTFFLLDRELRSRLDDTGRQFMEASGTILDGYFQSMKDSTEGAANHIRSMLSPEGLPENFQEHLAAFFALEAERRKNSGVTGIFFGSQKTGELINNSGWIPPEDYDPRKRDWYVQAVKAGSTVAVEPYKDAITGKITISVATPLYDRNRSLIGVVGTDILMEHIQDFVTGLALLPGSWGLLLSPEGTLLASPEKNRVLKSNLLSDGDIPESLREIARRMAKGLSGRENYRNGEEEFLLYYENTLAGYPFAMAVPERSVSAFVLAFTGKLLLLLGGISAIIVTGLLYLTRRISRGTGLLVDALDRASRFDFSVPRENRWIAEARDEFGDMARSLISMKQALRHLIGSTREISRNNLEVAETLASLSQEQLASMEEIRQSMEEIESLSDINSRSLENTSAAAQNVASGASMLANSVLRGEKASSSALSLVEHSSLRLEETLTAVEEAQEEFRKSNQSMEELAECVKAIETFVSAIQDIADQTNLLALNAAIEAARAGDVGRGFAVVASEVRNLAEGAGSSASQINHITTTLLEHTARTLASAKSSSKVLLQASALTGEAREKLGLGLREVSSCSATSAEVASVSQQQAAFTQEIGTELSGIVSRTGETAAMLHAIREATDITSEASQTVASHAINLTERAQEIASLLERFHFDESRALPSAS